VLALELASVLQLGSVQVLLLWEAAASPSSPPAKRALSHSTPVCLVASPSRVTLVASLLVA
jgi:hypothetical protein